jgi:hypothetical protein
MSDIKLCYNCIEKNDAKQKDRSQENREQLRKAEDEQKTGAGEQGLARSGRISGWI